MNNPDRIYESLKKLFFGLKYLSSLMWIRDRKKTLPGSGRIDIILPNPDRDQHPGPAILFTIKFQYAD
jgi:hypothetical protein